MTTPAPLCWHCGNPLAKGDRGPIFASVEVQGATRRVHMTCAEALRFEPTVATPRIFPEGPEFRKYSE